MRCDVCDHEMAKWDRPPSQWCREIWICGWCYAVTQLGTPDYEVLRAGYTPWDLRWEAAWSDMLPDASRHAYGYLHKTLCGIEKPDLTGSRFAMWGGTYPDELLSFAIHDKQRAGELDPELLGYLSHYVPGLSSE